MSDDLTTIDEDSRRKWMREELRRDVEVMRAIGVTEWRDIKLGPAVPPDEEPDQTQPRLTPEELQERGLAERKRIASAASGGPVKLVGANSQR